MKMLANRKPGDPGAEVRSPRTIAVAPLLAAAFLFVVGLWGLIVVSPYTPPSPFEPLFVVRPDSHLSTQPTADAAGWLHERGPSVAALLVATTPPELDAELVSDEGAEGASGEPAPAAVPAETQPESTVGAAASVSGAGGSSSPVGQVSQPVVPTPTPVPPTPTFIPQPAPATVAPPPTVTPPPTGQSPAPATPTPTPEPAPSSAQPVAAFFDPNLEQPTPASSYTSDESHPVHQPDSAIVSGSSFSFQTNVAEQTPPAPGPDRGKVQPRESANAASGKKGKDRQNSNDARKQGGSGPAHAGNQGPPAHAGNQGPPPHAARSGN